MTRVEKLNAIWRTTHRDYKGKVDGERSGLVLRHGGTVLVPLSGLTDAEIERLVPRGT